MTAEALDVPTKELFGRILNGEGYRLRVNVFRLLKLAVRYLLYTTKYDVYDIVNYLEPYIESWRPKDPVFEREELFSNVSFQYQQEAHLLRRQTEFNDGLGDIRQQVISMKAKGYKPDEIIRTIKKMRYRYA